jgi:DNA-binding transcriptional regulator YhcF (GntR family)
MQIRKNELANDFKVSINTAGLVISQLEMQKVLYKVGETKGAYYIANTEKICRNKSETII